MTSTSTLLRELEENHEQMALMAERLDWESVSKLWQTALPKFVELEKIQLQTLSGNQRSEAHQSLHKLLTLQNQMLARIIPWMEQVRPLLQSFRSHPTTPLGVSEKA